MVVAGEASGDLLAAELVSALRTQSSIAHPPFSPRFIGAGGPRMAAAGVELAFDLTRHAAIGVPTLKNLFTGRRLLHQLLALAREQKPDALIGVDYGFFNLRLGHAVKQSVRKHPGAWNPKLIQFVSPQVWASRPGRANRLATDYDLLLSIFPFEKEWYAKRAPALRVEFVGHPLVDRLAAEGRLPGDSMSDAGARGIRPSDIVLLPGSRRYELQRHLPVMLGALKLIRNRLPGVRAKMVLPNDTLKQLADELSAGSGVETRVDDLPAALSRADLAISKTGTITLECAGFGVPTVTLYKTTWLTYQIARRIVTVKSLTMPNLLADEEVFPEFVQGAATPENLAGAALELLQDETRRRAIKSRLEKIISSLGEPGAAKRAAAAVLSLLT